MRRWFFRRNGYRDVWLVVITGLVVFALAKQQDTTNTVGKNQRADTAALCSFKKDLQKRIEGSTQFLQSHPHGAFGIPAATIRVSIGNAERTLYSLRALIC